MKRILAFIFLGFLTLNSNLFSMEKEQSTIKTPVKKQQLSKIDMVKVAAASLGCTLFTSMALLTYPTLQTLDNNKELSLIEYPSAVVLTCFKLITQSRLAALSLTEISTTAAAIACGSYVYKKLNKSRSNS